MRLTALASAASELLEYALGLRPRPWDAAAGPKSVRTSAFVAGGLVNSPWAEDGMARAIREDGGALCSVEGTASPMHSTLCWTR